MKNSSRKNNQTTQTKSWSLIDFIQNSVLFIFSVILFVISNCNFIFNKGLGFFAWFAYIPVLFLIHKASFKTVWLWGGLYGFLSYLLYAFWLKNYDFAGLILVVIYFFILYEILFLLLKSEILLSEHHSWILQWLTICAFDYLRTLGFTGLNYGIMAYTQWNFLPVIQICDITGVFGLNAIVIFFSCLLYGFFATYLERKKALNELEQNDQLYEHDSHIAYIKKYEKTQKKTSQYSNIVAGGIYAVVLIFTFVYGFVRQKDYSSFDTVKVAAIQHNENPLESGITVYNQNLQTLQRLTNEALEINPDIDIVLWPETAVVPAVVYHYNSGNDKNRYKLVESLLNFIDSKSSAFIIGNGHTVKSFHGGDKKTYNSALLFYPKKNTIPPEPEIYSKNHLVPFSEYFPYDHIFPEINKKLMERTTLWEPGTEINIFNYKNLNFSTPICFEDNFTHTGRNMYLKGSRAFFNLSNDAWSKSDACQYQHLAMAVIRSVENRVPGVRSTTSGITCAIDPNGRIIGSVPAFCESYLVCEIPVIPESTKPTVYTKTGDYCGYGAVILTSLLLIIRLILCIIKKSESNRK